MPWISDQLVKQFISNAYGMFLRLHVLAQFVRTANSVFDQGVIIFICLHLAFIDHQLLLSKYIKLTVF